MSKTYTVRDGDTLLQIAIDLDVDFNALLTENPNCQRNPDFIPVGLVLTLPEIDDSPLPESSFEVEPVATGLKFKDGCIEARPACQPIEACDILFMTGDGEDTPSQNMRYWVLDADQQQEVLEEASITENVITQYRDLIDTAPSGAEATEKDILKHRNEKRAWLDGAVYAGIIAATPPPAPTEQKDSENLQKLQATIAELDARKQFVQDYYSIFNFFNESSSLTLRNTVSKQLEEKITQWKDKLPKAERFSMPNAQTVNQNNINGKKRTVTPASHHVVEVWVASQNQLIYLRDEFIQQRSVHWETNRVNTHLNTAIANRNAAGIKEAILSDIKKGVMKDRENGAFGKLEATLKQWPLFDKKLIEWKSTGKYTRADGEVQFAASAEAQLMRFGAQASVTSTFEPAEGKVDIGIGVNAKFSLAEAAVNFDCYIPYENGYTLSLGYKDAKGKPATYHFGRFRAKVNVMLSSFVGAMGQVSAQASNQPQPNPGTSILLSPDIGMGITPTGGVGVKAEGFAGAQVGGQVSGALEWECPEPDTAYTGDFKSLAEIKVEGNVSLGAGASYDFQLAIVRGEFIFYCSAHLVWGPGAGGGFGTTLNMEKVWELAQIIWGTLDTIGYRQLDNINKDCYDYLYQAAYAAFGAGGELKDILSNPTEAVGTAVQLGGEAIGGWWLERQDNWAQGVKKEQEARRLAGRLLASSATQQKQLKTLPPEALGMMLNTLVHTFYVIWLKDQRWEEKQERAIILVLGAGCQSWRKFEEVLCRMNPEGSKPKGDATARENAMFTNMDRINAILDGGQQRQFNDWVNQLAQTNTQPRPLPLPFTPYGVNMFRKNRDTISQQIAQLHPASTDNYV